MIPFASQRGSGQDLATHLMNERDNEYMELAHLRGSIAYDLHGAFAEWEAQASALTKCSNYLYSMSVNPDPAQPLSREQYLDYLDRAEEKLGLSNQPRAVVFHIKNGREHCHAVWSRIDAREGKAVHLAFDKDKLMMVTRAFARDHGLTLPDGYNKDKERESGKQLSLYEKAQQDETGLTKEQRIELVTQLWRSSDSAKAFVNALASHGYLLATGNRPFVLVDLYGQVNALPKMIGDRQVRTNDIRAFLGDEFGPANLPSIEEAKLLAARHRKAIEAFEKTRAVSDKLSQLRKSQAERRKKLVTELAALKERQQTERTQVLDRQSAERAKLSREYAAQMQQIKERRDRHRATGLAAFLGRVTGIAFVVKAVQQQQDRRTEAAHLLKEQSLAERHRQERELLERRFELQQADPARQLRGLDQIDARELRALETSETKERRSRINGRHSHMPSVALELKPRGRMAVPHKAKNRHRATFADELVKDAKALKSPRRSVDLLSDFSKAARDESDGKTDGKSGEGKGKAPKFGKSKKDKKDKNRKDRDDRDGRGKDNRGPKGGNRRGPGR